MPAVLIQRSLRGRYLSFDETSLCHGSAILDGRFPRLAGRLARLYPVVHAHVYRSDVGVDEASGSLFQLDDRKMSVTFVVGHDQCQPNVGHATVPAFRPFCSRFDASPPACWDETLVDLKRRSAIK